MTQLIARLDYALYPGQDRNWDNALFRNHILSVLRQEDHILDLGAGAGIVPQLNFRGTVQRVCGVDPDERVTTNPYLDDGRQGFGEQIPFPDNAFDLVYSANVLEHLTNPLAVFTEVNRVLKPNGRFLFKTPNRWHYMPLIAQLTPTRFHKFFNRLRGRAAEDTFPTRYRANSNAAIGRLADRSGFTVKHIRLVEGRPEYLRFSAPTYLMGAAYERLMNRFDALSTFRIVMIGELEKSAPCRKSA
jgi:ubiquinone/menaquinone biosynthesis C-methylase UbiE